MAFQISANAPPDETIDELTAALSSDAGQPAKVYVDLLLRLYQAARFVEGEAWSQKAVAQHPEDFDSWNIRAVFLRQLARQTEALAALDEAAKLDPRHPSAWINRGIVLLDMGEGEQAEAVLAEFVQQDPNDAVRQRLLGRALVMQRKYEAAEQCFRKAVALKRDFVAAWRDLADLLGGRALEDEAREVLAQALAANPDQPELLEARAAQMHRLNDRRGAETFLLALLPRFETAAWVHYYLGLVFANRDRARANQHFRRAFELAPENLDYRIAWIESQTRTWSDDEGAQIEAAYQLLHPVLESKLKDFSHLQIAYEVLSRVAAFDELEKLGSLKQLGRLWAAAGCHTAFFGQLPRAKSDADRLELLDQHRTWGRVAEARAAEEPIRRTPPQRKGRIRLGFMSSDLRNHPVTYFAQPLFDHIDRERFEVFCYSYFQGAEDPVQAHIASQVTQFRLAPDASARDAAQMIADDKLDMLIELGGSTAMNKLEVMAWRPAPRQASWLGYPHSAGLSTIDYLICDPYSVPTRPDLLFETPLMLPDCFVAFGPVFSERHPIIPGVPEDLTGRITFGTANSPTKYNPETLALWAEVMRRVPGSRFMFIRPETGSATLRANLLAAFEAGGVTADRIEFQNIPRQHMPFYNFIDISLDTAPFTGGTTTAEALWMGVPVVSLVGEALFERLSFSMLSNCGLGDLATTDRAAFVEIAVALAADKARRLDLRHDLRRRIRSGPLGRTEDFARDFYDMIARVVAETPGRT